MKEILIKAMRAFENTPEKMFFFIISFFVVILTFKVGYFQAMFFLVVVCGAYLYANTLKNRNKLDKRKHELDEEALRLQERYLDYMIEERQRRGDEND